MERYVENYEIYHHNLSEGDRQGFPEKKKFLTESTSDVNVLSYGLRCSKQIEEKTRNELKIVKRCENTLKLEEAKTGGFVGKLPGLINVQRFVHEALERKQRFGGITGGRVLGEGGGKKCDDFVNKCVIENEKGNKSPCKKVKLVDVSEENNRNPHIKEDLLAGDQLEVGQERELLEIKTNYSKRKVSV